MSFRSSDVMAYCHIHRTLLNFCHDILTNIFCLAARPSFLVTPRDKVVGAGRRVSIRCEVTGNPMPAVFWNKASSQVGSHQAFLVHHLCSALCLYTFIICLNTKRRHKTNPEGESLIE